MVAALLVVAGCYFVCGVLFAAVFVTVGVSGVDATAKGAGLGFRMLILPGSVALWPYLLIKWVRGRNLP